MRVLLVLLVALLGARVLAQGGLPPGPSDDRFTLEVIVPSDAIYVGQSVPVVIRVGIDAELLREGLVQSYARVLDLPVHFEAPWLTRDPRTAEVFSAVARTSSVAVNDTVDRVVAVEDAVASGRRFRQFELRRRFFPNRAGEIQLAPVDLRFATASKWGTDLFGARIPMDRIDGRVRGTATELYVEPLPAMGRPLEDSGLIGEYTLRHISTIGLGSDPQRDGVRLLVELAGEGNGDRIPEFRFEPVPGFRLAGVASERSGIPRRIKVDLYPRGTRLLTIGGLRISAFNPKSGSYEWASTGPLSLLPSGEKLPPVALIALGRPQALVPEAGMVLGVAVAWLFTFLWVWRRRHRLTWGTDAAARRDGLAYQNLRTSRARDEDPSAALGEYLAARLRVATPEIHGLDWEVALRSLGVPLECCGALAEQVRRVLEAPYGKVPPTRAQSEVDGIVQTLESHRARDVSSRVLAFQLVAAFGILCWVLGVGSLVPWPAIGSNKAAETTAREGIEEAAKRGDVSAVEDRLAAAYATCPSLRGPIALESAQLSLARGDRLGAILGVLRARRELPFVEATREVTEGCRRLVHSEGLENALSPHHFPRAWSPITGWVIGLAVAGWLACRLIRGCGKNSRVWVILIAVLLGTLTGIATGLAAVPDTSIGILTSDVVTYSEPSETQQTGSKLVAGEWVVVKASGIKFDRVRTRQGTEVYIPSSKIHRVFEEGR